MDESKVPVRLYYRIGEVSDIVGVEPHVLRYWEAEFRSIRPQKSRKGQRIYSKRDVDKLKRVKELLYSQGFTIAGARRKLQSSGHEPPEPQAQGSRLKAALEQLRRDVKVMLDELDAEGGVEP